MRNATRQLFNGYRRDVATMNGVEDVAEKFNVGAVPVQTMVELQQEESSFLKNINLVPVNAQSGQKLGLGIGSPIAGRTDTANKERETRYVGSVNDDEYFCKQTNFDTHVPYATADSWSHTGDNGFRRMYSRQVMRAKALNRIMVGWNGVSAAKETDLEANPLLQDVNAGWLEKTRLKAPENLMGYDSEGKATGDVFNIGESGDYATLDAAVFDIAGSLLDPWFQESDDLVLILGRELWVNHGLTLYNENRPATERNALQTWFANEAVAGLTTVRVPYFPARGLVVTSYDNLSLYYQESSTRRAIIDNPKRDRIEEYLSSNDAYIVEDYGKFAGFKADVIKLKNAKGEWH